MARRACFRIKRRHALAPVIAFADELDDLIDLRSESEFDENLTRVCLEQAITELPTIYRDAYVKREIEGLEIDQAARELHISVPALKSRTMRARMRLQRALDSSTCFGADRPPLS